MKVFLIGAAGKIGRRLAPLLAAQGDEVSGMHRAPEQAQALTDVGAVPVAGDLVADPVDELAAKMAGHDAVVFSAGAGGAGAEMISAIDGQGLRKAAAAAAAAGARRFVLVSVFPESRRGGQISEGFEHYLSVKKAADAHLAATDLHWLIVRPGGLLDERGSGRVSAGPALEQADVPRDDVAGFIATALAEPALDRRVVELTAGTEPIADAARRLART